MFRPATIDDAFELAPRLREADRRELDAQGRPDHDVVLAESIAMSEEVYAFVHDSEVHAVFGVVDGGDHGVPWMLGSDMLFNQSRQLVTLPQQYLKRWLARYGLLQNMVHAENHRSIRWLKRIGFEIHPPFPYGTTSFHLFTQGKPHV